LRYLDFIFSTPVLTLYRIIGQTLLEVSMIAL
jgi:hypothetical protein